LYGVSNLTEGQEEVKILQLFSGRNSNRERNREKIEKIILENYNQYYRLAFSYVHNEDDACDIVQNGAYKAIRSSHTLKDVDFAATWVYQIMLNECFQHLRKPKHASYESLADENGFEEEGTLDSYEDVDLRRALDELQEKDKAVIIMKYFEDKTLGEVAEILDENISTVKSRLYRSMKKLRQSMEQGKDRVCK
jgi:RNA polymerase sigma-70 factor (ECF subfamily)